MSQLSQDLEVKKLLIIHLPNCCTDVHAHRSRYRECELQPKALIIPASRKLPQAGERTKYLCTESLYISLLKYRSAKSAVQTFTAE